MIIVYILLGLMGIVFILVIIRSIRIGMTFKAGHNPYTRICKKCGAHQVMYESNIEGEDGNTWWEEVYPIGNDENCICHSFAEYH